MRKKILVIEDEKNIVDILVFNLIREGYDTLEAYDGATGLRLALEQDPDLILLDLMLPEMDGFEVCRRLRGAVSYTHRVQQKRRTGVRHSDPGGEPGGIHCGRHRHWHSSGLPEPGIRTILPGG